MQDHGDVILLKAGHAIDGLSDLDKRDEEEACRDKYDEVNSIVADGVVEVSVAVVTEIGEVQTENGAHVQQDSHVERDGVPFGVFL